MKDFMSQGNAAGGEGRILATEKAMTNSSERVTQLEQLIDDVATQIAGLTEQKNYTADAPQNVDMLKKLEDRLDVLKKAHANFKELLASIQLKTSKLVN